MKIDTGPLNYSNYNDLYTFMLTYRPYNAILGPNDTLTSSGRDPLLNTDIYLNPPILGETFTDETAKSS